MTTELKTEIPITGMTCASCASRVERKLNELDGVHATVNFATERATVDYDPRAVDTADLTAAVESAGYEAVLPEGGEDATGALRRRVVASTLLSTPVLVLSMISALRFDGWEWLALALATPVVFWGGWPFHRAAWVNLRHRAATMDTLVSIGTLSALLWSVYALSDGDDDMYLDVASVVTTFVLLGRYFEARAKRRAGAAIEELLELGAKEVAVLDEHG